MRFKASAMSLISSLLLTLSSCVRSPAAMVPAIVTARDRPRLMLSDIQTAAPKAISSDTMVVPISIRRVLPYTSSARAN